MRLFRPGHGRSTGLTVAAVVMLACGIFVAWFAVRGYNPRRPPAARSAAAPDPSLVPAKDASGNRFGGGDGFFLQIADKDDPTQVRAEISALRSQPVQGETFKVALEKPVIWTFLKDGRLLYARSDTGTAYMPDQVKGMPSKPRDGMMEGHVVIKLFELAKGAAHRPDPETDAAVLEAHTSKITYDAGLQRAEAPEHFTIVSAATDYEGSGATVLFNDVQQRIEQLHVAHTDRIVHRPWVKKGKPAAPRTAPSPSTQIAAVAAPAVSASATKPPSGHPASKPPVETLYRIVCDGEVRVVSGTRQVSSDRLETWLRLVDNKLRPGAVGTGVAEKAASAPAAVPAAAGAKGGPAQAAGAAAQPIAATASPTAGSEEHIPVMLTWSGPMDARPIAVAATELAHNDVFARFSGQSDTAVRFTDAHDSTLASGNVIEYAATQRAIGLGAGERLGALLSRAGSGRAQMQRIDMDLVSGIARIPGPGQLTGLGKTVPSGDGEAAALTHDRTLAWTNTAEFRFDLDEKKGVSSRLALFQAQGRVSAGDEVSSLAGNTMIAKFAPVSEKASRLAQLNVLGRARGADGKGGVLTADTFDIAFAPMPGKPEQSDPVSLTAQGIVRGERKDSVLDAEWLKATIARVEDGRQLGVTHMDARAVTYTDDRGITATAPSLSAEPVARTARLFGDAGTVHVKKEGSVITGQDMTFMDVERRLHVEGPGTLTHQAEPRPDAPTTAVTASWKREMSFDDIAGTAACLGDAQAVMTKSSPGGGAVFESDTMAAEQVDLFLTPALEETAGNAGAARPERTLRQAQLRGSLAARPDGAVAKVESQRFSTPAQGQKMERRLFLEGARINVDNERATLDVPTPGKLLVVDRRPPGEKGASTTARSASDPLSGSAGGKGTSLFSWAGSMNFVRETGTMTMDDTVRLTHQRDNDPTASELECNRLVAHIREVEGSPKPSASGSTEPEAGFSGELVSADAVGSTWMRYNGHELAADKAMYDAQRRTLNAKAEGTHMVKMLDPKTGAPVSAKEIFWDLVKDRIDFKKPGAAVLPR